MKQSLGSINSLVEQEIESGVAMERIVIGGFSQGAALCTLEAVTGSMRIAGVVSLSGYLPAKALEVIECNPPCHWRSTLIHVVMSQMRNERANELPLFIAHGQNDSVIKLEVGKRGADRLRAMGMKKIEWHEYPSAFHTLFPRSY